MRTSRDVGGVGKRTSGDCLDESLVVEGYATGAFPMPLGGVGPRDGEPLIAWYSPVRRGILPLDGMRVTRSLRKSAKRYAITTDTAFEQVLDELRCRLARDYLTGRRLSVNETAYLLGFSDPAAFSRAFKRWTGESPSAAREPDSDG